MNVMHSKGGAVGSPVHYKTLRTAALVLLALAFACLLITVSDSSDVSSAGVQTGTSGGCDWSLDTDTLTLTVSKSATGDGAMYNYSDWDFRDWSFVALKNVIVEEGVTHIGVASFLDCSSILNVTLPSTVTSIGAEAFSGCSHLTSISFPAALNDIGFAAFSGITFYNSDGTETVAPTPANLAGKTASMIDGKLCLSDEPEPEPADNGFRDLFAFIVIVVLFIIVISFAICFWRK